MPDNTQTRRDMLAGALRSISDPSSAASDVMYRDAYLQHVQRAQEAGNSPISYPDFQRLMKYQNAQRQQMQQQAQQQPMPMQNAAAIPPVVGG